ncbi:MAG: carboxylating nicotinate-nucleotide diphosphorylase [Firmicutes bacterium]|uniref:Probable nicotinate-nucleotide pyrophosphorylase [carboxylating] n=1 Tax=Melghirimyces thermohalophilus TaxID=1236220 RepID=A0A1G6KKV6_9BACL|nr:carboxylating nicotinate-nucleotide diphosphorylase [Melghirimyces thermohalophilus]MDA8354340.1 carboxylating nicotinate-nucleotide diphosphorylase [Bacillota bacterium]SDC31709.1 nicotinate-nucleotide pyrophosphorylase [carboxylating] [Melghirimyces thermohalophilus]
MNQLQLQTTVREALNEDLGSGDGTTEALVSERDRTSAVLLAKQEGVVAGLLVAEAVYQQLDPTLQLHREVEEGERVTPGTVLAQLEGSTRALLSGERVALNFLQRLSGIATVTRQVVDALAGLDCQVLDTRKTTPGLRMLEKYAVRIGGGSNHRFGLSHAVMIKDNHIAVAGSLARAVARVREYNGPLVPVEVEADTLEQVEEAVALDVDAILLDNMDPATLRQAVERIDGRIWTEASGGITPETARQVAETGVNGISLGWLTHSVDALDISLDIQHKEESI